MESRRWWNSVPGTQILSTRIQQSYLLKMKLKYFADYKNLETLLLAGLPYKIAKGSSLGWKKASVPRWKFGSTWTNSTSNSNHVMSEESVWTYFLSSFFLKADLKSNCLIIWCILGPLEMRRICKVSVNNSSEEVSGSKTVLN